LAEALEKLDKSFFTRKLGPGLRVEISAAKFDSKRLWAALKFPRPYRWATAGACHHEIFVWAKSSGHVGPLGLLMKGQEG
jgi:hypothetical protein